MANTRVRLIGVEYFKIIVAVKTSPQSKKGCTLPILGWKISNDLCTAGNGIGKMRVDSALASIQCVLASL